MTSSMHAAIFFGEDFSDKLHSVTKIDKKPIFQKLIGKQNLENLGSVRNELEKFYLGKAVPGERRRSNQAREGESLWFRSTKQ